MSCKPAQQPVQKKATAADIQKAAQESNAQQAKNLFTPPNYKPHLNAGCPLKWMPPKKWDFPPNPYPVVVEGNKWDNHKACTGSYTTEGQRSWGCTILVNMRGGKVGSTVIPPRSFYKIIVPKVDTKPGGYGIDPYCHDRIVEHEWGHINSKSASHDGWVSAK